MNELNRPLRPLAGHSGHARPGPASHPPATQANALLQLGHDLRAPMIALLTDLAAIDALPPDAADRRRAACAHAGGAVREALQLIEALLDLAGTEPAADAPDAPPAPAPLPLEETGIDAGALLRTALRGLPGTAALVLDLPEDLPRLRLDVARFRGAVHALVGEAIHAAGPQGCVGITARVDWISGDLLILVSDDRPLTTPSAPPPAATLDALHAHGAQLATRADPAQGQMVTIRLPAARVTGTAPPHGA